MGGAAFTSEEVPLVGDRADCAFEELISFHGGLGGSQTRPFILSPERLTVPDEPIIGAA